MLQSISRIVEYFSRKRIPFAVMRNILWYEYNRMVVPVGPVKWNYALSKEETRELLGIFPKALMVRSFEPIELPVAETPSWYAVVCDRFVDISQMRSALRNQVNRGMQNCIVRRISPAELAELGLTVYKSAYYNITPEKEISTEKFKQKILWNEAFSDLVHYWGVFKGQDLIGYAINWVYDKVEVNYSTIKLHSGYLKDYPAYSLIYQMNRHYLTESGFECVNDGFRNLAHESNIQKFLEQKFNFHKLPLQLSLTYRPIISVSMMMMYPFRALFSKVDNRVQALFEMESIRREKGL